MVLHHAVVTQTKADGGYMNKILLTCVQKIAIFAAFLCIPTCVLSETAWVGFDYIFDYQNNINHGFKIYKNIPLFEMAGDFQLGDTFKMQFLDNFLASDGKSITVTKDILNNCETYIGAYQYTSTSGIAAYLGKKDTETVKMRVQNALTNFKKIFEKEIQEPLSELTIRLSDTDEMRYIKRLTEWAMTQTQYTENEKNNIRKSLNDMFYRYRIPAFNIFDKNNDGSRLTRTMYEALQQLGKECGFMMKPLTSWTTCIRSAATNKYFWMAVGSLAVLGGGIMLGKYMNTSTTPSTCPPSTGSSGSWFSWLSNKPKAPTSRSAAVKPSAVPQQTPPTPVMPEIPVQMPSPAETVTIPLSTKLPQP